MRRRRSPHELTLEPWVEETLYFEGDDYFRDALAAIDEAQESVLLESYIFQFDGIGKRFLHALESAAARGVEVRILVDAIGSPHWNYPHLKKLGEHGIQAKVYHPIRFDGPLTYFAGQYGAGTLKKLRAWTNINWTFGDHRFWGLYGRMRLLINRIRAVWMKVQRINRRNHRKLLVVDNQIAFVGSFNISMVHSREFLHDRAWRDSGVRVKGSSVRFLRDLFFHAWLPGRKRWFWKKLSQSRDALVSLFRINVSMSSRRAFREQLIDRIEKAKARVWITNPYFVPEPRVLAALSQSGQRGVDVRILVPETPDVGFVKWAARHFYSGLISRNIRIFEYQGRVLHAKTLLVDEWAVVGSTNLNHRSLLHDLELDLILNEESSIRELAAQFEKDLVRSRELNSAWIKSVPTWQWILGRLVLTIKYWM